EMILGSCKVSHQQTVKFCGTSFSCDRIIRVFSFMINCPSISIHYNLGRQYGTKQNRLLRYVWGLAVVVVVVMVVVVDVPTMGPKTFGPKPKDDTKLKKMDNS
ncbi:hypothetical protein BLOT_014788, partial [Blomia tropicalis]